MVTSNGLINFKFRPREVKCKKDLHFSESFGGSVPYVFLKFSPKNENLAKKNKNSKSFGIQPNSPRSHSKDHHNSFMVSLKWRRKEELPGATSH